MIGWWLLYTGALLILTLYMFLPDLLLHRLGLGSSKRQYSSGVALTFDDGPDPAYTPRILDVLAQYQVPATFFVVGEKVAKYPEIIQRIQAEGHQLGIHCHRHLHAWLLKPRETWKLWDEGVDTLERLTGQRVEWIRPPWGTFNLSLWYWTRWNKRRAVLWSVEGHDWLAIRSPRQIAERILRKTKPGTIIVLHDSGGEKGAPENTLQALTVLCQKIIHEQKLPIVPLEFPNWSFSRVLAIRLWEKWEWLFSHLYNVERINAHNLLRLSRTRYKGPFLYSKEGEILVKRGDWVGEIHFDNIRFLRKEADSHALGIQALREIRKSLSELAHYVAKKSDHDDITAFIGLTLINRGAKGLGFHIEEVPSTVFTRGIAILQRAILRIYHPTGKDRVMKERNSQPKLLWISKEEFLEKWVYQEKMRDLTKR